ncbi:HD domain-containing protein [Alicyclobacillus kakegawensis]|uniref:HD domain-containing protein n=1 Tax=Alicyclobacillus kakegawensis TaxID=392012 RepID=UPI00082C5407|nr:HD domain-containing protein [Alicyclobacillus kakegawensis]
MNKEPLNIENILPEVNWISDLETRKKVCLIWERLWQESSFTDINQLPVVPSTTYPHIPHNRAVVHMAVRVAEVLEEIHGVKIDRDDLIAAALLQDASKLVEYRKTEDGGYEFTEMGSMFQHAFYAAHLALQYGLPHTVVQAIFTHTPDSAQFPPSLIARILFYVDQIDTAALGVDRWKKTSMIYR